MDFIVFGCFLTIEYLTILGWSPNKVNRKPLELLILIDSSFQAFESCGSILIKFNSRKSNILGEKHVDFAPN